MGELRPYQEEAVKEVLRALDAGEAPLVHSPTGSGKSVIQAHVVARFRAAYPDARVLCLVHVGEIVSQNAEALRQVLPDEGIGIACGGLGQHEFGRPVTVGTIQTLARRRAEILAAGGVELILIDEAHRVDLHATPPSQYARLIHELGSGTLRVGMSATPWRFEGSIVEGPGRAFTRLIATTDIYDLIQQGYLAPAVNAVGFEDANALLAGVRIHAGEFARSELIERMANRLRLYTHADEMIQRFRGRRVWLVFTTSIQHAELLAEALRERGVDAAAVHHRQRRQERADLIQRFRGGDLTCLVNVDTLTTGFDVPHIDAIALCTATRSSGKYVQMVGRGLRLAADKTDCLILDFGGNLARFGPASLVRPDGAGGVQYRPVEPCRACQHINVAGSIACDRCGVCLRCLGQAGLHRRCQGCGRCLGCGRKAPVCPCRPLEADRRDQKGARLHARAGEGEVIAAPEPVRTVGVVRREVTVSVPPRMGRHYPNPALKVTYTLAGEQGEVVEWLRIQSPSRPLRQTARARWRQLAKDSAAPVPEHAPAAIQDVVGGAWREVVRVVVRPRQRRGAQKGWVLLETIYRGEDSANEVTDISARLPAPADALGLKATSTGQGRHESCRPCPNQ